MLDTATSLAAQAGSRLDITDHRSPGTAQDITCSAVLTPGGAGGRGSHGRARTTRAGTAVAVSHSSGGIFGQLLYGVYAGPAESLVVGERVQQFDGFRTSHCARRRRREGHLPLPPVKFRFDRWGAGVRRSDGSLEPRDPKYKPPPLSVMAI